MLDVFIKHFIFCLCGFSLYYKILNKKANKKTLLLYVSFSVIMSIIMVLSRILLPEISIILMIVVFTALITLFSKTDINVSIMTSVITFAINYLSYVISTLIIGIIFDALNVLSFKHIDLYGQILISTLQFAFLILPFKLKRFKNGMPFLMNKLSSNLGVIISVFILITSIVLTNAKSANYIYAIPIALTIIFGLLILLWWRRKITKTYLEKIRTEELNALQKEINEKNEQIKLLEQNNESLAKIIHKDNKLIPALELSVRDYLQSCINENPSSKEKAEELLEYIGKAASERSGIVNTYETKNKTLPSCGVLSVDALMTYMLSKAKNNNIDFDVSFTGDIKFLIANVIDENYLNTLLADLIENAVIATKKCDKKRIFVNVGVIDNCYSIDVFDSGIPFETNVIMNIGVQKITTHANEGGSGIGLATAFEILRTCKASFIIEEFDDNSPFTKKVSIKFDKLNKYIVKSKKVDENQYVSTQINA